MHIKSTLLFFENTLDQSVIFYRLVLSLMNEEDVVNMYQVLLQTAIFFRNSFVDYKPDLVDLIFIS